MGMGSGRIPGGRSFSFSHDRKGRQRESIKCVIGIMTTLSQIAKKRDMGRKERKWQKATYTRLRGRYWHAVVDLQCGKSAAPRK